MHRFPPELLHKMFIQLDLNERLICTLVCHNWWTVLDTCSLLYNIKIKEVDQFSRFMDMIERSPHRAAQMEDLTIHFCFDDIFNKRYFCNMFPNLRKIEMRCLRACYRHPNYSESVETTQAVSKIQYIADCIHCEYASQMMTMNLCGQLGTLCLNFSSGYNSFRTLLPQMKNMPVLKRLNLVAPEISIADIEHLHNNIPSIQYLELSEMVLEDSEMPPIVKPAIPLTAILFDIQLTYTIETHANWYQYVTQKYTNAIIWNYNDKMFDEWDDDTEFLYDNGYLQFLEFIGHTQSELNIHFLPANVNVFELLDNKNCRTTKFSLFRCGGNTALQYLANSNQSKYIETLSIRDIDIGSPFHFKNFMVLTKLKIEDVVCADSYILNLTDCLNSLPDTLKEFSFYCDELESDPMNCKSSSIERLAIGVDWFTRDLMDTVFSCFPNLIHLELLGNLDCSLDVTIQSQSLKHISLYPFYTMQKNTGFSFKSPDHDEPRHYLFRDKKVTQVEYKEIQPYPVLLFESFTERRLELIDKKFMIDLIHPDDIY